MIDAMFQTIKTLIYSGPISVLMPSLMALATFFWLLRRARRWDWYWYHPTLWDWDKINEFKTRYGYDPRGPR